MSVRWQNQQSIQAKTGAVVLACPCHAGILVFDWLHQCDCNVKAPVTGVSKFFLVPAEGDTLYWSALKQATFQMSRQLKLEENVGYSVEKP